MRINYIITDISLRRFIMIYVVRQGDTIDSIAMQFSISAYTISYINQIPAPYGLAVGQALLIPGNSAVQKSPAQFNGYAYPFISRYVLTETLQYLSALNIFSYGFTAEGELIPPQLDDSWMIAAADEQGVAPILTLTPFGVDGNFNNNLITAVVNDPVSRTRLKDNLINVIMSKGFQGVDIDFEFIKAEDRDAFTDFVRYIREAVNALGFPVSVTLAPKVSADQPGLLYEGKDYPALGAVSDYVLVMTYEWGYKYGPPLAVAPADRVRQVLDYAVSVIPPEKIQLGISNYGYDWTLPYVKGQSAAVTIGSVEAVQLAVANGAQIMFDTVAQSPYFTYEKDGLSHIVWFEDVRSMQGKYDLIKEYSLRGGSVWTIMNLFRGMWVLAEENFIIS